MSGQAAVALAIRFRRRWLRCGRREQRAAQRELGGAMAVDQEPEMADAMKAVGHGMQCAATIWMVERGDLDGDCRG